MSDLSSVNQFPPSTPGVKSGKYSTDFHQALKSHVRNALADDSVDDAFAQVDADFSALRELVNARCSAEDLSIDPPKR